MPTKIEKVPFNRIKITEAHTGAIINCESAEANLLFAILEKLEEIKTLIGDRQFSTITAKDIHL